MNVYETFDIEIENKSWTHAYLLIGGDREEWNNCVSYFKSKLNCLPEDIISIEPEEAKGKSGEIKVESVRELLHSINLTPNGMIRIVAIYKAESLNQSSGNVLLKSLEEPQGETIFLLFSHNDSVLTTIRSRCRVVYLNQESEKKISDSFLKVIASFQDGFLKTSKEIETIVKEEKTLKLCENLMIFLEKKMVESKDEKLVRALEEVNLARKDILNNANARLTLENLILKIGKYL